MIVTTKDLFQQAYGKYAIGAYNINNLEQTVGLFRGCLGKKNGNDEPTDPATSAPFIIQISRGARAFTDKRFLEAMIRTADWKLIYCSGTRARDDGYKTDQPTPGRTVRLFDLEHDPQEAHNLSADPSQQPRVEGLKQRLAQRLAETCQPSQKAPDGLSLDQQLDWYVFPPELRGR